MGYAAGQLFSKEAPAFINSVWAYFESQVESVLPQMPQWLQQLIADLGKFMIINEIIKSYK